MIRLFAENPGQANPNLALRWCVDRETLDELKTKGVKNPQLLLVVVCSTGDRRIIGVDEIERKLVPLEQAMEWLEFNRLGRHTIYATIVWDSDKECNFKAQWLLMERKACGGFERKVFDCDGKFLPILIGSDRSLDEGSLDVVVEKEFFAKEPPAWLKWWVNLWFDALCVPRPANQCSFRKRKWFVAFPIQPIPVFVWVLLKSLMRLATAVVLALCGMRGVSFKPVIHPFELDLQNVWYDMGSSVFLKDKSGYWHSPLLFFFMPILPVSYFAILSILNLFFYFSFWLAVIGAVGLFVGTTALVSLASFVIYITSLVGRGLRVIWRALLPPPSAEEQERRRLAKGKRDRERWEKKAAKQDRKEKEERERQQREFEAFYEGLQDVTCIGVPLKPKIESLPYRRRTFHLLYRDLKAKVCKPFAR